MAEVIGPLGFCFGAISFIFSTIPTVKKAGATYRESARQLDDMRIRLAGLDSRYQKWGIIWKMFDFGKCEDIIAAARRNLKLVEADIEEVLEKHRMTDEERQQWNDIRLRLRRGLCEIPTRAAAAGASTRTVYRHVPRKVWNRVYGHIVQAVPEEHDEFHRSLGYALWKKDIMEGWLSRMSNNLESIERVCDEELRARSARQIDASAGEDKIREFARVETSITQLSGLANELHQKCAAVTNTHGWALGFPVPSKGREVANWDLLPKLDIELRFSAQHLGATKDFQLRVPYYKDLPLTHASGESVQTLVQDCINLGEGPPRFDQNSSDPKCKLQDGTITRTRPLRTLFRVENALFRRGQGKGWKRWRLDRRDIVKGLLHWNILLWETAWTTHLCSSGIQIEKDLFSGDTVTQVFTRSEHFDCEHSRLCLRNLGIVLAEIILAKPIRSDPDDKIKEHRKWQDNSWMSIMRSDIHDEILTQTGSEHLSRAIQFCMEDDLCLATGEYRPGYIYRCIEKIWKP